MTRTAADWVGNLIVFAIVIVVNVLSNALPINGQTMPEISARYPSLFTPAGFTFSIWGVIYLCLLVFVIWQALPAQRNNETVARISKYFQANCLLNAAWLILWHHDELVLSLVFMVAILVSLVLIYRELIAEQLVLRLPFSLYTGWITLATIANASILQNAYGWDAVWLSPEIWTIVKLSVAASIAATVLHKFRDPVYALPIAWGGYGISVKQFATPLVSNAAMAVSLAVGSVIVIEVGARIYKTMRERNQNGQ